MSLAVLRSRAPSGFDAPPVTVEVHLAGGLPAFNLVGLPDTEVRESRDRVRAALQNAQFEFPARKITVNLAPADLPRNRGASTCRSRWGSWRPRASCRHRRSRATNSPESSRSPETSVRSGARSR
jgi:Subunit ChlI of Mg-chelatase